MNTAPLVLELRLLRDEVSELRESHNYLLRRLLERDDRRTGSALVPLLAEVFDDDSFGVADLAAHALNGRDVTAQALRELVAEHCTEAGGLRALGRFLARLEGASFGGLRLVRAGAVRGALRWRVAGLRPVETRNQ